MGKKIKRCILNSTVSGENGLYFFSSEQLAGQVDKVQDLQRGLLAFMTREDCSIEDCTTGISYMIRPRREGLTTLLVCTVTGPAYAAHHQEALASVHLR